MNDLLSQVEEVHYHPKFNPRTVAWDISLFKVRQFCYKIDCKNSFAAEKSYQFHRSHLAGLFAVVRLARYQLEQRGVGDWMG